MASAVQFAYGLQSKFDAMTKDANTIYFCTDSQRLFRGDVEFSRPVQHGTTLPTGYLPPESIFVLEADDHKDLYFSKDGGSWVKIGRIYNNLSIGTKGEAGESRVLKYGDSFKTVKLTVDEHGFVTAASEIELTLPAAQDLSSFATTAAMNQALNGKVNTGVSVALTGDVTGTANLTNDGASIAVTVSDDFAKKSDLTDGSITAKEAEHAVTADKATSDAAGNNIANTYATKTEMQTADAKKADKVDGAIAGNLAGLDANGNLTDSGVVAANVATKAEVQAAQKAGTDAAAEAQAAAEAAQGAADAAQAQADKGVQNAATAQAAAEAAQAAADAKVGSVSAADGSIAIGGTATAPTVSVEISAGAGNALSLEDDGLMVTLPTAAEYSIVKDENGGDYAAVYHLTKDGVNIGAAINIPKDMVVKSGRVDEAGNIILVLNDEAETEITINAASLIEYVTSGSATGDMVVINVSDDHKVTATITDGTITAAKLTTELQTKINQAHTHSNKTVLDGIDADKVAAWDSAATNNHTHGNKALLDTYTQTEADLADAVAKKHEHSNKGVLDGITAGKVSAWDSAEANAVATAAADATAKANAAQTAAATDATNKANQALADAKDYADGAADEAQAAAEATASADATSKANQALEDAKAYTDSQISAATLSWVNF